MVIPHDFEYVRPNTLEEATRALADCSGSAQVLAGGTDLVAWLRDDAVHPDLVVDIKAIDGLRDLAVADRTMTVGSLVTFTDLMESSVVAEHAPLLSEAAETVASPGIRNRATVVGNICSAVPSCDAGPVLLAYDAHVHLVGPEGFRSVPIEAWFVGLRQTARREDEIVTHLTMELPTHGGCYVKLMRYGGEDLAQAAVAIVVDDAHDYRIAFGAVAPTPVRAHAVEDAIRGRAPTEDVIAEAVAMVRSEISPINDLRATAEYRAHMCEVMLARGLVAADQRRNGDGPEYRTRLI
ncbi:MAG: xanthine dehydrogenase family protein subunit M [Acidimicrobiia bacterium]|nr:xanthine dehydrogenase family protein subunit M [Acidimicrobiia bacterium]